MQARELAEQVVRTLDKHKAQDVQLLRVEDVTTITDYFVIAAGTSSTQVKALVDYVEYELDQQGVAPLRVEGYATANWILLDYGSVVVHVFTKEARDTYSLERLWSDGEPVDLAPWIAPEEEK